MRKLGLFLMLLFVFTLSGCDLLEGNNRYTPTVYDGSFDSEGELVQLLTDYKRAMQTTMWRDGMLFAEAATDDAMTNDYSGEKGSDEYSETNVQVQGVDEMDNVKTDGKYLYIVRNNKVSIVLAYTASQGPDALTEVTEIIYEQEQVDSECGSTYTYINGLYVDDDRLTVITNTYSYTCTAVPYSDKVDPEGSDDDSGSVMYHYEYHYINETDVYTYELETFELLDHYTLSGSMIGTRKINDDLYVITRNYIRYTTVYNEELEEYEYTYQIEDSYPYYAINDGETTETDINQIIYEDGVNPDSFTAFYGINLSDDIIDMEVVLGDSGYNLYVSTENIYLVGVDYSYYWWRFYDVTDEETIDDTVDNEIKTNILKLSINGVDLSYEGRGQVAGRSLNQFSMDEYNGYLRITTTNQSWWWWGWEDGQPDINNRLFILDENLEVVSTVENLGKPGEVIQSTRFSGPYAYVVTFERTDPFYVINVEDPLNPFVEGELEIPGFSSYLQPLNNDYILGIGFDADSEGRTTGLKLSIYDVSDKENPVVFDEIVFPYGDHGWVWSSSTYNHKDLIVDLDKGIIAFPMTMTSYSNDSVSEWHYTFESGVMVYNISLETGLSYNGFMTQSENTEYNWNEYVYKGQFIGDYFYAISNQYITVAEISDVETELQRLVFSDVDEYYKEGYYID